MKIRFYLSIAVLIILAVVQVQSRRHRPCTRIRPCTRYRKNYATPLFKIRPVKPSVKPSKVTDVFSPSIVGGEIDETNQFTPFMVAIHQDGLWFCGGTLINRKTVLTAAHCVFQVSVFDLHMGSTNWRDETTRTTEQTDIAKYHELYNESTFQHDIAIIIMYNELNSTYFSSARLSLVRLPRMSDYINKVTYTGKMSTAIGWGKTNNTSGVSSLLSYVEGLLVITNSKCKAYYGNSFIVPSMVCVYGNGTKNICNGDSGGPMMVYESDGNLTQIGVTCFGAASTCYLYPSGFTRITFFLQWLQSQGIVIRD